MKKALSVTDCPQDFMLKWLQDQSWEVGYAQRNLDWIVTARKGSYVIWAYGSSLRDACRRVVNRVALSTEVN